MKVQDRIELESYKQDEPLRNTVLHYRIVLSLALGATNWVENWINYKTETLDFVEVGASEVLRLYGIFVGWIGVSSSFRFSAFMHETTVNKFRWLIQLTSSEVKEVSPAVSLVDLLKPRSSVEGKTKVARQIKNRLTDRTYVFQLEVDSDEFISTVET